MLYRSLNFGVFTTVILVAWQCAYRHMLGSVQTTTVRIGHFEEYNAVSDRRVHEYVQNILGLVWWDRIVEGA